jgi:hypothetical protein
LAEKESEQKSQIQFDFESYAQKELESFPLPPEVERGPESDLSVADTSVLSEDALRVQILLAAIESSNNIYKLNQYNENSKRKWRKFFIVFCCVILVFSLIFVFKMIYLSAIKQVTLSTEALAAMFTYIIANLFSILFFMIKYVHNDKYLETFKIVTHKLLDYLIADKNGSVAKDKDNF